MTIGGPGGGGGGSRGGGPGGGAGSMVMGLTFGLLEPNAVAVWNRSFNTSDKAAQPFW